ncbi:hypothetical protein IV73_GL000498 [Weissella kandleri]|uniref:Peptidase S9 prolyl oligopeptidase catalytic domain-containing protein n=1 Tax=Weissella kandleri TaxID=1616 RepID=A0A0R2JLS2_9LACO|nr:alpha/beta hydrolase [Weissella kandleri]KRN75335.1 hypothetical protein IV73_GL000498 [Weissella kandleri]
MKINKWVKRVLGLGLVICLLLVAAGGYFFHVAEVRADKDFIKGGSLKPGAPLYDQQEAWQKYQKHAQVWNLQANDGVKLKGDYVPAEQATTKTALVIHGFGVDHQAMAPYAAMFHQQGYNVLLIDNRAAGRSGGKYIGYGYLEAKDAKKWTQMIVEKQGADAQIVVMGASLGGATTMMLSGMNPPAQVKAYVEDAGYHSIYDELIYQANEMYHIPAWLANPLVHIVSGYSRLYAGYSFKQGNVQQYLVKNHRPMLFIHGEKDSFVPTKYIKQNYRAQAGPKQMVIVPKAEHTKSYAVEKEAYVERMMNFLNQYLH